MSNSNFSNVLLILEGNSIVDENFLNKKREDRYNIMNLNSLLLSKKVNREVIITLIKNVLINYNLCNTFLLSSSRYTTTSNNSILFY